MTKKRSGKIEVPANFRPTSGMHFFFKKLPITVGLLATLTGFALTPGRLCAIELLGEQSQLTTAGYFRAGIGASEDGNTQTKFIAPGAQSKYRLGNEPDTNIEIEFDYRWYLERAEVYTEDSKYTEFVFMLDTYAEHGNSDDLEMDNVAKAYISFDNLIGEGIGVWGGRRRYHRKDIHLNDHFWLNPGQGSQAGAGIEGIQLGPGILRVALFRFEDEGVFGLPPFDEETGLLNSEILDLRVTDIPSNLSGTLNLWGQLARREDNNDLGFDTESGYAAGFWHLQTDLFDSGSQNRFAMTFRQGSAMVQGTFNGRPVRENYLTGYDLDESYAFEINNDLLIEPGGGLFAMQWGSVLRWEKRGVTPEGGSGDTVSWYSTGVRPIFFLSDHVNIAWETGIDYVDNEPLAVDGNVLKSTVALQIAAGREYFSRPVFRIFITEAWWSDEFVGLVGNEPGDAPYGNDDHGRTVGAQIETWW